MAGRSRNRSTLLIVGLLVLVLLLASTGEAGGSVAITLFAGAVVVWMVFAVLFGRRRR